MYGFVPMDRLSVANDNIIQENLLHLRNAYYSLESEAPRPKEEEDPFRSEISSVIDPNPSYFGAMGLSEAQRRERRAAQEFEENFIDSDNEDNLDGE